MSFPWALVFLHCGAEVQTPKTFTASKRRQAGCLRLTPVILATQEAEIRRITVHN
jgi:hypothetical protein